MSYIDNNLMRGEEVIYRASLHWVIFIPGVAWFLLGLLISFIPSTPEGKPTVMVFASIFFLLALYNLLKAIIYKLTAEYAITNKRLILKKGLISRNSVELMLTKCEGVALDQGILGRILGYGTLVSSTGGIHNKYKYIKDPIIFRNYLNTQIDEAQRS